jgi:hypothetical protein
VRVREVTGDFHSCEESPETTDSIYPYASALILALMARKANRGRRGGKKNSNIAEGCFGGFG